MTTNKFGERLKIALKDAGYTQKKATESLGLSKNAITNYVAGRIPDAQILYKLARLCSVSMEWLLTGDDDYSTYPIQEHYHIHEPSSYYANSKVIGEELTPELSDAEQKLLISFRQAVSNNKKEDNTIDADLNLIQKLLLLNDRQKGIIEGRIDSLLEAAESKETSSILIENENAATDETA
ncbi:hypothetical protein A0U40_15995 [[Bacillus] sp. KCTC 13219]|nr:hypothetical protein A0U40_15995 [[Bacillus] sp. KCTC 13219]